MDEEKKPSEEQTAEEAKLSEPISVKDLLLMTIYSLEGKAWAYLGLVSHPETKKPKKDIAQAQTSIDAIDAIYNVLKDKLSSDERKDLEVRLTNLRMNFVKNQ